MLTFRQHLNEQRNPWIGTKFDQAMIDELRRNWGSASRPPNLHPLDFNGDGVLNIDDLNIIMQYWGTEYWEPGTGPPRDDPPDKFARSDGRNRIDPRIAGVKNGVSPAAR